MTGGAAPSHIISVNLGRPRLVPWRGRAVPTGIFKQPVPGRVAVRRHNLDGDEQADLSVHGGATKAVYAYPSEHYDFWRAELADRELPWGTFGENLTTAGLREDRVRIGERFRMGSAELQVTEPRLPCFKLGIKLGRPDMVKRFLHSGRTGFYLAVVREGDVGAGDAIESLGADGHDVTVADLVRLAARPGEDPGLLERILAAEALPASWREQYRRERK